MTEQLLPLGEIVATHGLEGWVKLDPFNPETAAFESARDVILERNGNKTPCALESSRRHGRHFLLKLRDINGIDEAKRWVGATILVGAEALGPLAPGQYYHCQVVGLDAFDLQGRRIGVITRVWSTGGGELYVVRNAEREYLIPAVKEIIEKVDFASGRVIINPPEGLLDL